MFYHQLIEYHTNIGEIDQAIAVAKRGAAKTNDLGMRAMVEEEAALRKSLNEPSLRQLIVPLLTVERFRNPTMEAMNLVAPRR